MNEDPAVAAVAAALRHTLLAVTGVPIPWPGQVADLMLTALAAGGYHLVRLPTPTGVVTHPDGTRSADFGPVSVVITPPGDVTIHCDCEAGGDPAEVPLAAYAAARWAAP